mgnify:FL=1
MKWFYFHCILVLIIFIKDHNGTLESSVNKFEESVGIKTEVLMEVDSLSINNERKERNMK